MKPQAAFWAFLSIFYLGLAAWQVYAIWASRGLSNLSSGIVSWHLGQTQLKVSKFIKYAEYGSGGWLLGGGGGGGAGGGRGLFFLLLALFFFPLL